MTAGPLSTLLPLRYCLVVLALAATAPSQQPGTEQPPQRHAHGVGDLRYLGDLGDPERGEAAERSLLARPAEVVPVLQEQIDAWNTSTPREVERMRALLRVIDLLGDEAASLAPALAKIAADRPGPLVCELCSVRASLAPYARDPAWHEAFAGAVALANADVQGRLVTSMVRLMVRDSVSAERNDVAAMRRVLAMDPLFGREVAAEALARLEDPDAIDLLRASLLDRKRPPRGWDQIRHNGFVAPIDDQFRLRASEAMLALAPDDVRCTIALGCRALLHPHRCLRRAALQSLARFGPDAAAAIPELLQIARGGDAELASEALKILGMAGRELGADLAAIEALQRESTGAVQRLAASLVARLRAMGFTPPSPLAAPTPDPERAALLAAVGAPADAASEAATTA
ncbi:MAG: hypothetical protein ABIP94_14295, partial [Planctomycetota bacterium]